MGWGDALSSAWNAATEVARAAADVVASTAQAAYDFVTGAVDAAQRWVTGAIDTVIGAVLGVARAAYDKVAELFGDKPAGGAIQPCPMASIVVPKGCEYLNKGGTVEAPQDQFDRIRKPAQIGPEKAIKHTFPGDAAESDAISQTVTVDGREIEVIRPKNPVAPKKLPSTEQIAAALGAVPGKQLDAFDQVVLSNQPNPDDAHWAQEYNDPNFYSAATGGPGGVTFYPKDTDWDQAFVDSTAIHEGGHAYSGELWKDAAMKEKWEKAIAADGRSPSDYSDNAATEDFSESLVMYSLSKGTPCEATARSLFPNRYKALDELLQ